MRTKVIAALLAILTALGGLNLFQSIKQKLNPSEQYHVEAVADVRTDAETMVDIETDVIRVERGDKRFVIRTSAVSDARNDREVMISERFDVKEGASLRADVAHAEFNIITGSSDEAEVEVTLDSNRMSRARERFEEMNWSVAQRDGDIIILADDPRGWNNWNFEIDVTVRIPSRFNIDLETTHGDVVVGDLEGELSMQTSHGDVELGDVTGGRMWIKTSHGDISGQALRASLIEVHTSHADLEFEAIESEEFSATTSHADVEIESLRGESEIRTSHGDVRVELVDGLGADITTTHGDVMVYVAKDARLDLDVRGAEVKMSSSFNLNGRMSEEVIDGHINGGGRLLRVRTSHGEVSIR